MLFTSSQLKALRNQFDKTSEDIGTRFVDGDMDLSTFVQVAAAVSLYIFATFNHTPLFYCCP
jgi:hypothetical protein